VTQALLAVQSRHHTPLLQVLLAGVHRDAVRIGSVPLQSQSDTQF
jgi:hypothetical protein